MSIQAVNEHNLVSLFLHVLSSFVIPWLVIVQWPLISGA